MNYRKPEFLRINSLVTIGDISKENENKFFYGVVQRDGKCTICKRGPEETTLTMRVINGEKLFLVDNFETICYDCLLKEN